MFQQKKKDDVASYFENIRPVDQNTSVRMSDIQENREVEVDYFISIFTEGTLEIIQNQTNLYASQEKETNWRTETNIITTSCNWTL